MKIHFLCNDGSPMGVAWSDIYEKGVGGAELALLSLAEEFVKRGHEVIIYNNPNRTLSVPTEAGIHFDAVSQFDPRDENRILIVFRSPNKLVTDAKAKKKIWWSTDQYTVGDFRSFAALVGTIITISERHSAHLREAYKIDTDKLKVIDLGVRDDYGNEVKKIKNRLIYCSVPDRGLQVLHAAWPLIKNTVPDATLVITSDYRLWGNEIPNNHYHRLMWAGAQDVEFLGRISRKELVEHQKLAEIHSYPCIYDELFCISVAECQVAGAYPVTSGYGALETTNRWGTIIPGIPTSPAFVEAFVAEIFNLLVHDQDELFARSMAMSKAAKTRFSWPRIAEKWEKLF